MASVIVRPERFVNLATVGITALEPSLAPVETERRLRLVPESWGANGVGADRAGLARATMEARIALEEAAVAAAAAAQRAIDVAEALDATLAILVAADRESALPPALPGEVRGDVDTLSPREREVWALVAEGRSNKAIAETLFVSPNTVKTHVASLLGKLRADSRAHLAAMAARRGLIYGGSGASAR